MSDNQQKIREIQKRLDTLVHKHNTFVKEVSALKAELSRLMSDSPPPVSTTKQRYDPPRPVPKSNLEPVSTIGLEEDRSAPLVPDIPKEKAEAQRPKPAASSSWFDFSFPTTKIELEKFIGENLINKIGILITIFGVVIGARYAIANNMVSPLTRVVMGYLMGLGLMGVAIRLKEKYENFSAVLISGAIAILYFITYTAYDFYGLIPQLVAFALMVIFTIFTVIAALHYKRQIIAHFGLVGAYAVPFLLSNNSGDVFSLFAYMVLVNCGILAISFKQYWKPLLYVSFCLTWIIFLGWFSADYDVETHLSVTLIFGSLFFAIFYGATMAYKLARLEKIEPFDIGILLMNAFIFYGIGYLALENHQTGSQLLGLFTVANAVIHFGVAYVIQRFDLADRNLFHLIAGLVLVFLTMAIPVQLDGVWVTIIWAAEAALLFWLSRTKGAIVFERMSYVLMFLAFGSILIDWVNASYVGEGDGFIPILNVQFLSGILFVAAFSIINYLMYFKDPQPLEGQKNLFYQIIYFAAPAILLIVLYNTFRLEIDLFWQQRYADSVVRLPNEPSFSGTWFTDLLKMKNLWMLNYSMFFATILAFFNIRQIKNKYLTAINLLLMGFLLLAFFTAGNHDLSILRNNYITQNNAEYFDQGIFHLVMRYISFGFAGAMLYAVYRYIQEPFMGFDLRMLFDFVLHLFILFGLSTELIAWMEIAQSGQPTRLGLSILWGFYALAIITYGIWENKGHLRLGGIALLAITLLKLFFYDLVHLDTIPKTILLVTLGILLLVISFLYNKFTNKISNDEEK